VSLKQWMPTKMVPCRRGNQDPEELFLEPENWSTRLLAGLAAFSAVTAREQDRARRVLEAAVGRSDRGTACSGVLQSDVRYAIERWKQTAAAYPGVNTTPDLPVESEGPGTPRPAGESSGMPNKVDSDTGAESRDVRLLSLEHRNVVIKQEPELRVTGFTGFTNVWSHEDELDRLRECELRRDLKELDLRVVLERRRQRMRRHGSGADNAITLRCCKGSRIGCVAHLLD